MRERIFAISLVICLLVAFTDCSGTKNNKSETSNPAAQSGPDGNGLIKTPDNQDKNPAPAGGLKHVSEVMARFGAQDGFNFFKSYHPANEMEEGYDYLMYIDYATGKQIYLCNKSNCSHSDSGCTSYVPTAGAQGLFTYKNRLYRLSDAGSRDGKTVVPGLFVSDLDGTNQKMLYQLDSGMKVAA